MSQIGLLRLQAEIDKGMGSLVKAAEEVVTDLGPKVAAVKESQVRNVMAVANTAPHTSIITSFIRYQIGRRETQEAWKETGLGVRLVGLIDGNVREMAEAAVKAAGYGDVSQVHVELTRLLLGFMNRRHVYELDRVRTQQKKEGRK